MLTRTLLVATALLLPLAGTPAQAAADLTWKETKRPAGFEQDELRRLSAADGQLYAGPLATFTRDQGAIHRATPDGQWTRVAPGSTLGRPISQFLANGPSDLYQVDERLGLHHFDGTGWTRTQLGEGSRLSVASDGLWGSAATGVYVAGHQNVTGGSPEDPQPGVLFHGRGTNWQQVRFHTGPGRPGEPQTVWGVGQDVYLGATDASVYHLRNGAWTQERTGLPAGWEVSAIGGTSAADVWAYAHPRFSSLEGALLHSTGNGSWREVRRLGHHDKPNSFGEAVGVDPGTALLTSQGGIYRVDLSGGLKQVYRSRDGYGCRQLTVVSANRVAAVCNQADDLVYGVR